MPTMAHHEPFKALGPVQWADVPQDDLASFLRTTFSQAQIIVDSIPGTDAEPGASAAAAATHGRARSQADSAVPAGSSASSASRTAGQLRGEWKGVKVSPRDNPLGVSVYKLPARDGGGSWFARRSVHEGVAFDAFRTCLQRELQETLKVQEGPGAGSIRGIGADRREEDVRCPGVGRAEVYVLSARFGGPTTPREFVTLFLSSAPEDGAAEDGAAEDGAAEGEGAGDEGAARKGGAPRQFMIVSRPCGHPGCEERQGFIRGQYESVEVIREVPVDRPLRKARSSADLSNRERGGAAAQSHVSFAGVASEGDAPETAVEWLMITRSDPGGSVPRFMIEKGTPGGIVNDAGRFLKWLARYSKKRGEAKAKKDGGGEGREEDPRDRAQRPSGGLAKLPTAESDAPSAEDPGPGGVYGMIAAALGLATAYAAKLPNPLGGFGRDTGSGLGLGSGSGSGSASESPASETSSLNSFASADEGEPPSAEVSATTEAASTRSVVSDETTPSVSAAALAQHEKELRKLQERQRKIQEKIAKSQERERARRLSGSGSGGSKDKDGGAGDKEAALAKLREKHEREVAKQEDKFQRELRKLEAKRRSEERKAEEKRRKQAEREERGNLAMELERVKAERDVARKQAELLQDQVGELQRQNTLLAARLGRLAAPGGGEAPATGE